MIKNKPITFIIDFDFGCNLEFSNELKHYHLNVMGADLMITTIEEKDKLVIQASICQWWHELKEKITMYKKMINIELTDEDAELFKKFRQYQDDLIILAKTNFFTFKNGQATIHRDAEGQVENN